MVSQFRKKITSLGEELGLDLLAKEIINTTIKSAGKSKDELVQILGREIGLAWAAVLKEPLEKIIEGKSLQITIELVSKEGEEPQFKVSTKKKKQKRKQRKIPPSQNTKKTMTKKEFVQRTLFFYSKTKKLASAPRNYWKSAPSLRIHAIVIKVKARGVSLPFPL